MAMYTEKELLEMNKNGGPFAFSGKIVEAYYTNPEQDSVGILWSDGKLNREYHVVVDEEDDQFIALLREFNREQLEQCTLARNEAQRQVFREAFDNYAKDQNYSQNSTMPSEKLIEMFFDFDADNTEHKEELFKLKLAMFNTPQVKESDNKKAKTGLRKALTMSDAIDAYKEFLRNNRS